MSALSDAVQAAFNAADIIDAITSISYVVPGQSTGFNPVTETYDNVVADTTTVVRQVVRESFTQEERANPDIKVEDIKLTFQQSALAVAVLTTHYILIDSVKYHIRSKSADPANLIWIVHARGAEAI